MTQTSHSLPRQHAFEPLRIEGSLPSGLAGTLYRNGPAVTERFGVAYSHVFEGDGGISAVRLDGRGGASGAFRVLQTAGYLEEEAAGRHLYGFAARWPTRVRRQLAGRSKNTANTSLLWQQDSLYALMEAARPVQVDPDTLDVVGETDLGGALGPTFSAHPHRVGDTLFNFGQVYGGQPHLLLYAWPDGGACRQLGKLPLPRNVMVHDFIATKRHLVFFLGPAEIVVWRAMMMLGPFDKMIHWNAARGTEIVVVPLDDLENPSRWSVDPFWVWHFANAWDEGEDVVVDYVRYPDLSTLGAIGKERRPASPATYHRARLDPRGRSFRTEERGTVPCEFPRLDERYEGRPHKAVWVHASRGEQQGLARLDPERGTSDLYLMPSGWKGSEPVFVARPGAVAEGDGWVLALQSDPASQSSALAVYEAGAVSDGPVARCWFDHGLPLTFHGVWSGENRIDEHAPELPATLGAARVASRSDSRSDP
jgi:all-trans-8'-apo-beta-carotenal 15,15'-oxygenase